MIKKIKKGVIYFSCKEISEDLKKSVESVREFNKNVKIAWITEFSNNSIKNIFDITIKFKSEKKFTFHKKAESFLLSPFNNTLYLDGDTIVNGELEYGFLKSKHFGIAICQAPAYNSNYIARATENSLIPINKEQTVYNAGVVFYQKTKKVIELLKTWIRFNDLCSTGDDQSGLSNAFEYLRFNPFILNKSWNFRAGLHCEGYGPIKIWHSKKKQLPEYINNEKFFKL